MNTVGVSTNRVVPDVLGRHDYKIIGELVENGAKVLDLGCGGGLVCEPLARLGANVTGVDFVEKNIEVAKEHSIKSNLIIHYKKIIFKTNFRYRIFISNDKHLR